MVEPVSTTAILGGAAIGALGNFAGNLFSGKSAKHAEARANALSIWQQLQAQKWQEYMSNTAHQREVKDLKEAGLNPTLSANSGASIGSVGIGNAPQTASMDYTSTAKGASEGLEKALAIKAMDNQTENTNADIDLKEKTGAETIAKKDLAETQKNLLDIQKPSVTAQAKSDKANAELKEAEAKIQKEIIENPIYQAGLKFRTITNEFLGPLGTMFNMAVSGRKAQIASQIAKKYGQHETLTESYDQNNNPLGFKVHHWNN